MRVGQGFLRAFDELSVSFYSTFACRFRMIFFLATLITSTIFITDRLEGIWDRTLVAGISTTELLMAHIITQSTVMLVQCTEIVVLAAFIFDTENHGDNLTVILLLMMLGFAGMLYGLFISIFCDSHTMANFMATGSFYPMIILCGECRRLFHGNLLT